MGDPLAEKVEGGKVESRAYAGAEGRWYSPAPELTDGMGRVEDSGEGGEKRRA